MEFKLNNGYQIPVIGIGTWQLTNRDELLSCLEAAFESGYRHIDTACFYGNEAIIGEFIKRHKREELYITTKLWNTDHDDVMNAIETSLKNLGISYVDLYLVHWPVNLKGTFDVRKLWQQMETVVELKKAKSIGVSNFGIKNMQEILSFCRIKPAVNQIELHPYWPQYEIREFCASNDIQVVSYSSLGSSNGGKSVLCKDQVITKIASKHRASVVQVILSFLIYEGIAVIPRSKSKDHIKSNLALIKLSETDRKEIRAIRIREKYVDPVDFGEHRFD